MNWFLVWAAISGMVGAVSPAFAQCVGDCNGDGSVAIGELVQGVAIALAEGSIDECPAFDMSGNGIVSIGELITAVKAALAGCEPATPIPTATGSSGFRICGKAGERPGGNPPLARNVVFTLNPLGAYVFSTSAGIFCFEGVPPGDYTISVREHVGTQSHCTEYGCWQDAPVTVVDSDILNLFIVMLALPTPTPAATCTLSTTPTPSLTATVTLPPTPTRTCQSAPPPATCPAGEVVACVDQLCSIDCGCGTVTVTPTPTTTCHSQSNEPRCTAVRVGQTRTHTASPCNRG
jgi:hypothetical protein